MEVALFRQLEQWDWSLDSLLATARARSQRAVVGRAVAEGRRRVVAVRGRLMQALSDGGAMAVTEAAKWRCGAARMTLG